MKKDGNISAASADVSERLKSLLGMLNINMTEFARKSHIPYRTIQACVSGENRPSLETLQKISRTFNVNLNWLISGEGSPFLGEENSLNHDSSMPASFIKKVREDIRNAPYGKLMELSFREKLPEVFSGKATLTRREVIELAQVLGKPVEEYLSLSNYIPKVIRKAMEDDNLRELFRSTDDFTPEELDSILNTIAVVIEGHISRKRAGKKEKKSEE